MINYEIMKKLLIYEEVLYETRKKEVVNMCKLLDNLKGKDASQLLEEFGMSNDLPINLDKLVEKIGIKVYELDFTKMVDIVEEVEGTKEQKVKILSDIWGMLITIKDEIAIFLKPDLKTNGKRFTIAHEIAHCCLNNGDLHDMHIEFRHTMISSDTNNKKEVAANIFAGELLMPEKTVKKYCSEFVIPEINTVAKTFKVSVHVASERLNYLNIPYINMDNSNESIT